MRKILTAAFILTAFLFLGFSKVQAYTATDYYNAGLQLYNAQNYAKAIQYFDAAIQMDPANLAALQGRANCYYSVSRYSEALADYQKVQAAMPSDALAQMIQTLQAKVAAAPSSGEPETPTSFETSNSSGSRGMTRKRLYRISAYISLLNLSDFNTNAQTSVNEATTFKSGDPNIVESGSVPSIGPGFNLEVENPLLPDFNFSVELGLTAAGTAQDLITNNGSYTLSDSYNILLAHFAVLGRLYLGEGAMQPWVAAGPVLDFGSVNCSYHLVKTGYTYDFNGPNTGVGFGGQAQLGMDFKITESISITGFAGYQLASVNSFSNTINKSDIPNVNPGSTETLSVVPTSAGKVIIPVDNGILCAPTIDAGAGSQAPAGTRPMTINDSGIFAGLSVAFHL